MSLTTRLLNEIKTFCLSAVLLIMSASSTWSIFNQRGVVKPTVEQNNSIAVLPDKNRRLFNMGNIFRVHDTDGQVEKMDTMLQLVTAATLPTVVPPDKIQEGWMLEPPVPPIEGAVNNPTLIKTRKNITQTEYTERVELPPAAIISKGAGAAAVDDSVVERMAIDELDDYDIDYEMAELMSPREDMVGGLPGVEDNPPVVPMEGIEEEKKEPETLPSPPLSPKPMDLEEKQPQAEVKPLVAVTDYTVNQFRGFLGTWAKSLEKIDENSLPSAKQKKYWTGQLKNIQKKLKQTDEQWKPIQDRLNEFLYRKDGWITFQNANKETKSNLSRDFFNYVIGKSDTLSDDFKAMFKPVSTDEAKRDSTIVERKEDSTAMEIDVLGRDKRQRPDEGQEEMLRKVKMTKPTIEPEEKKEAPVNLRKRAQTMDEVEDLGSMRRKKQGIDASMPKEVRKPFIGDKTNVVGKTPLQEERFKVDRIIRPILVSWMEGTYEPKPLKELVPDPTQRTKIEQEIGNKIKKLWGYYKNKYEDVNGEMPIKILWILNSTIHQLAFLGRTFLTNDANQEPLKNYGKLVQLWMANLPKQSAEREKQLDNMFMFSMNSDAPEKEKQERWSNFKKKRNEAQNVGLAQEPIWITENHFWKYEPQQVPNINPFRTSRSSRMDPFASVK